MDHRLANLHIQQCYLSWQNPGKWAKLLIWIIALHSPARYWGWLVGLSFPSQTLGHLTKSTKVKAKLLTRDYLHNQHGHGVVPTVCWQIINTSPCQNSTTREGRIEQCGFCTKRSAVPIPKVGGLNLFRLQQKSTQELIHNNFQVAELYCGTVEFSS